jgi:hypothetical protein
MNIKLHFLLGVAFFGVADLDGIRNDKSNYPVGVLSMLRFPGLKKNGMLSDDDFM